MLNSDESMKRVGLRCSVSTFALSFGVLGVRWVCLPPALMIFLGAGNQTFCPRLENCWNNDSGELELQESSLVHVGMEFARERDFPGTLTQDEFTRNLNPLPASPQLFTLSIEDIKLRQCKLGDLCWLATVPRPDTCARLAQIASRVNSLQGSDVYRINDLAKTVEVWREATVLKYLLSSHKGKPERGTEDGKLRQRSEKIHGGTRTLVGWSDAAYGDQSAMSKCPLGYVIGLMSSTLRGSRRIIQRAPKFTRKLVKNSLGGEAYAFSETFEHMSMLREFYAHFIDLPPGMGGLEDCDILLARLQ